MGHCETVTTMRWTVLLAWCLSVRAAERNPDEIIKRVTEQVVASAARIPSYTCVETIVREYYRPTAAILPRACPVLIEQRQHPTPDIALQLAMTDRLRLDVTMTGRGETFSWVGASRFDDRSIFQMVGGPMVTGAFGGFLSVIFKQDVHKFTFERWTEVEGRRLMEYSFQVSRENSSYRVEIPGSSGQNGLQRNTAGGRYDRRRDRLDGENWRTPGRGKRMRDLDESRLAYGEDWRQRVSAAGARPAAVRDKHRRRNAKHDHLRQLPGIRW